MRAHSYLCVHRLMDVINQAVKECITPHQRKMTHHAVKWFHKEYIENKGIEARCDNVDYVHAIEAQSGKSGPCWHYLNNEEVLLSCVSCHDCVLICVKMVPGTKAASYGTAL